MRQSIWLLIEFHHFRHSSNNGSCHVSGTEGSGPALFFQSLIARCEVKHKMQNKDSDGWRVGEGTGHGGFWGHSGALILVGNSSNYGKPIRKVSGGFSFS